MKQINLLPWRAIARARAQRSFFISLVITNFITLGVIAGSYLFLNKAITQQTLITANFALKIARLDRQLELSNQLTQRRGVLRNQIAAITQLQTVQEQSVQLLPDLAQVIPAGVYLTEIQQTGKLIKLTGKAHANSIIALFLQNLATLPWVKSAAINHLQTLATEPAYPNNFEIVLNLKSIENLAHKLPNLATVD